MNRGPKSHERDSDVMQNSGINSGAGNTFFVLRYKMGLMPLFLINFKIPICNMFHD